MVQSRHRQILRHSATRRFLRADRSSLAHIIVEISRAPRPENHAGLQTVLKRLLTALETGIDNALSGGLGFFASTIERIGSNNISQSEVG
jgi:hypothetical protein